MTISKAESKKLWAKARIEVNRNGIKTCKRQIAADKRSLKSSEKTLKKYRREILRAQAVLRMK